MTKAQPLTIPNLVSALKKTGFVTKNDIRGLASKSYLDSKLQKLRKQIDDDQFEARTEFYAKMIKPDLIKLDEKIDKVDNKVDKLSLDVSEIKDDLNGISQEFSTTPSREEFEKLSRSVFPQ